MCIKFKYKFLFYKYVVLCVRSAHVSNEDKSKVTSLAFLQYAVV